MAIHKFTRLITNGETIPVYGNGKPERDFTYIDDVETAIDRVDGFEIINLGESQTISVDRMIDLIETNIGIPAKREYLPMQPGDVNRTFADITKARELLVYEPETDIEAGIKKFVEDYQEQLALVGNFTA